MVFTTLSHFVIYASYGQYRWVALIPCAQWQNCCKKAGLPIPSIEHGVDLQDGTFADEYVSKWGLEDEMTKGHTKKVVKVALRLLTY